MAIVGGAVMPLIQARSIDATSPALSFIVPAVCFVAVGLYALYDLAAVPTVNARRRRERVMIAGDAPRWPPPP